MQVTVAAQAAQLAARPVRPARAQRRLARVYAQEGKATQAADVVDENIGEYCSLDKGGKRPQRELTTGEKEQLFLEAMMSYYYDGQPMLSDEEFENLKQELQWEGSKVVVLSKEEKMLLEARMAFKQGRPIMTDAEYDALKQSLAGSSVYTLPREGPVCTLGKPGVRGQKQGEAQTDYVKMLLLTVPPALIVGGTLIGADLLAGAPLMHLPGTVGVVVWCGLILPAAYVLAASFANLLFKDALVLKGACPNCGEVNTTYFGDILTVAGNRDKNVVKCPCCESQLTFDANERLVTVTEAAA